MNNNITEKLNNLLKGCQEYGESYHHLIGQGVSKVSNDFTAKFKIEVPKILEELFPKDAYKIKSSIGQGRITQCPWIAIMNINETTSTQEGVYIVFLFSKDLRKIYLTLAQGVTKSTQDAIIAKRNQIRRTLKFDEELLREYNELKISNKDYNNSAIYSNIWPIEDSEKGMSMIIKFKEAYEAYIASKLNDKILNHSVDITSRVPFSIKKIIEYIKETGLIYSDSLIKRFAFSLMAKRFLILSGLAGSGKTRLALVFASQLVEDKAKQMCVVSVGADWTNREPLLGFPNALQSGKYEKPENGVLDLLIEANRPENVNKPYFLILDEMNMSYVERYFADFLSSMESNESISLWKGDTTNDDTPQSIKLPDNLFIIGTINVDETTYMFSPKVLDRANVIEFKISSEEMKSFLSNMKEIDCSGIAGKAAEMGADFVELARKMDFEKDDVVIATLQSFFNDLKAVNAEFGYRSAAEIFRFISFAKHNDDTGNKMSINEIIDAAIVQKLLPKLHGSRKKLDPALKGLWKLCFKVEDRDILQISRDNISKAIYKESADKILRMYESANANGFTSFAEA